MKLTNDISVWTITVKFLNIRSDYYATCSEKNWDVTIECIMQLFSQNDIFFIRLIKDEN
jgi:hypothetical protein